MTTVDLREARNTDAAIQKVLAAPSLDAAHQALRDLFAGQLDFQPAHGAIALHGDGLPASATRIAQREGVRVVALGLPDSGRVRMETTRAALREVRATLAGDVLLVLTDHTRSEWHFVCPAMTAGREVLRRMVVNRGQPYRTVAERLGSIYDEAARTDLRRALEAAYDVEAVTKKFFRE